MKNYMQELEGIPVSHPGSGQGEQEGEEHGGREDPAAGRGPGPRRALGVTSRGQPTASAQPGWADQGRSWQPTGQLQQWVGGGLGFLKEVPAGFRKIARLPGVTKLCV